MASYDLNTDYQALIDEAVAKGDMKSAAKYEEQRNAKIAGLDEDGTNVYGATQTNNYSQYRDQNDAIVPETGLYTKDYNAAQQAADYHGVNVTPTSYNGQTGWYKVDSADRTVQAGTSGADEGLLTDSAYAEIQTLKQRYAAQQEIYNQAMASGDTAAAQAARGRMDNIHQQAETIRSSYGYIGGTDGGDYITLGELEATYGNSGSSGGSNRYGGSSASSPGGNSSGSLSGGTGLNSPTYPDTTQGAVTFPDLSAIQSPVFPDLQVPTDKVEDYSSYIEEMYKAKQEAAIAALEAAYQNNLAALDRAGSGLSEQYQNARNQTAGASELAARNFAQYAAAAGLNNGTGGQAEIARNVTLQGNLNDINTAEASAIADLQLQRSQAEIEYNNAIAQAQASGDYELANALYQEKVRVQNELIDLELQQQQYLLQKYSAEYGAYRDQVSDAVTKYNAEYGAYRDQVSDAVNQYGAEYGAYRDQISDAANGLSGYTSAASTASGSSGSTVDDYYAKLEEYEDEIAGGTQLTTEELLKQYYADLAAGNDSVQDYRDQLRTEYGVPLAGSGNSSGTEATATTGTDSSTGTDGDGVGYDNSGLSDTEIKTLQGALGVDKDGYFGPASQAAAMQATGTTNAKDAYNALINNAAPMGTANFNAAMSQVMTQASVGNVSNAESALDKFYYRLDPTQKAQADAALGKAGLTYTPG